MKKQLLIVLSIIISANVYSQYVTEPQNVDTNLSKEACWKKINEWVVNGFYRYNAVVDYEDKTSGWITVKGQYNPEIDGLTCTLHKQLIPCIEFLIDIKCAEKSCAIAFKELYYTFKFGPTSADDINNIATLESSTAEMMIIEHAGNLIKYNNELKSFVEDKANLLIDLKTKSNDPYLKEKERNNNLHLYKQQSIEFLVYAKAYNDMKLFAPHILREISMYLQ